MIFTGGTCGLNNLVSATIAIDRYNVCQSAATVNFTALPSDQYSWDFGEGTPVSNLQNPSHIFASAVLQAACGIYDQCAFGNHYTITVSNSNPNPICQGLNMQNTWSIAGGTPFVTSGYESGHYTATGTQHFVVTTEILDAEGETVCTTTYNSVGSNGRPSGHFTTDGNHPDFIKNFPVNIVPNPSKNEFNVLIDGFSGKVDFNIYAVNGRHIYETRDENFSAAKAIDLSHYPPGMYLLKITGENLNSTQKLVKN